MDDVMQEIMPQRKSSPVEMIAYLLTAILVLMAVAALIVSLPDLMRYLKIRSM